MDRDDPDADRRSRARRSLRLFLGRLFGGLRHTAVCHSFHLTTTEGLITGVPGVAIRGEHFNFPVWQRKNTHLTV